MTQSWNDDRRWWQDYQHVAKEAQAARELDHAARVVSVAAQMMSDAGRNTRFGLPADIRKAALDLRRLAEACVAELNEGENG